MTDTSSIVDSIVAGLAHEGLDGYEVYMSGSNGLTIEVKDGDIDVFVKSENAGVGLRASREERPGFVFVRTYRQRSFQMLYSRWFMGPVAQTQTPL
ncbi:MAG: DNA gyrase modulator [Desulfobacteria bacterium]